MEYIKTSQIINRMNFFINKNFVFLLTTPPPPTLHAFLIDHGSVVNRV